MPGSFLPITFSFQLHQFSMPVSGVTASAGEPNVLVESQPDGLGTSQGRLWTCLDISQGNGKSSFSHGCEGPKTPDFPLLVGSLTLAYYMEGESCCSLLHSRWPSSGQSKARRGRAMAPGFILVVTQMRQWRSSKADPPRLRPRKCVHTEKYTQQPPSHALPLTCPFAQ